LKNVAIGVKEDCIVTPELRERKKVPCPRAGARGYGGKLNDYRLKAGRFGG
jgi:hypothetical protein